MLGGGGSMSEPALPPVTQSAGVAQVESVARARPAEGG